MCHAHHEFIWAYFIFHRHHNICRISSTQMTAQQTTGIWQSKNIINRLTRTNIQCRGVNEYDEKYRKYVTAPWKHLTRGPAAWCHQNSEGWWQKNKNITLVWSFARWIGWGQKADEIYRANIKRCNTNQLRKLESFEIITRQ